MGLARCKKSSEVMAILKICTGGKMTGKERREKKTGGREDEASSLSNPAMLWLVLQISTLFFGFAVAGPRLCALR